MRPKTPFSSLKNVQTSLKLCKEKSKRTKKVTAFEIHTTYKQLCFFDDNGNFSNMMNSSLKNTYITHTGNRPPIIRSVQLNPLPPINSKNKTKQRWISNFYDYKYNSSLPNVHTHKRSSNGDSIQNLNCRTKLKVHIKINLTKILTTHDKMYFEVSWQTWKSSFHSFFSKFVNVNFEWSFFLFHKMHTYIYIFYFYLTWPPLIGGEKMLTL